MNCGVCLPPPWFRHEKGLEEVKELAAEPNMPVIYPSKTEIDDFDGIPPKEMFWHFLEHILDDDRYLYIFSVEEVNRLASEGMPFRDAYKKVGLDIEAGKFTHNKKVHHTHEGSIGNLCNDRIESLMRQVVDGFNFSVMEQAERSLLGR